MSSASGEHFETNESSVGRCSAIMWHYSGDNGFCDREAYGPQSDEYRLMIRQNTLRFGEESKEFSLPRGLAVCDGGLACPWHGGPLRNLLDDIRENGT